MERLLGTARRRFLVPVPDVDSIESLNHRLLESCRQDLDERTRGRSGTKRELLRDDLVACLPLPSRPFESRREADGTVNSESLVRFENNDYSVPVRYTHRKVIVIATGLFSLDGRPHLACVHVETTPVAAYQVLLEEVAS